ncbi:lytic transglycosylase domain-containing protein [Rhizobium leguminosarum]|uniref:lytic transglycosylase domain-containing protein n=1 Tax=Rhizobium leguminosarum TaxID=384 RepID=UPI001C980CB6|nr:transglycosylase SLT domain-containing protein [Rhizobium leguminosarum]MBY5774828.1 lytic transglycosylase domain-containing protein [Rhizobium leguminosarum]
MDVITLSPANRQRKTWSRSALWIAGTSAFLLTGLASGADDGSLHVKSEKSAQAAEPSSGISQLSGKLAIMLAQSGAAAVKQPAVPTIDRARFNARFDGTNDDDPIRVCVLPLDMIGEFDNGPAKLPGEAAGSANARCERTVHSPISVYSLDRMPVPPVTDPATQLDVDVSASQVKARPELLSGVPEDYARLALTIAGTEGVEPNWVLSVMRAENANFNPSLVSSAGAVGLMQVMPRIGDAFGAADLTDPEQNIRAGTRFLRGLIDKYRNPVLVAAAYNAGEPNVDFRHSLPLIRETADYVTRVVGYYTGTAASPTVPPTSPISTPNSGSPHRPGPVERAKSPMLVFSAATPIPPDVRPQREEGRKDAGGPVKIVKEEVFQ